MTATLDAPVNLDEVHDITDVVTPADVEQVRERITREQQMLAEVEKVFRRFMWMPHEHAYTVAVLWVVHSHLRGPSGKFLPRTTPRLYFGSKQAGCGKTMAMELTTLMAYNGEVVIEPSGPGLISKIHNDLATVGLDECDLFFGSRGTSRSKERAVINGGYKIGATVDRERQDETEKRNIHAPIVMAGKNANKFLTSDAFETLRDRSIAIILERKPAGYEIQKYRSEKHEPYLRAIAARLRRWGTHFGRYIVQEDVERAMPKGIDNRDEEVWTALFQVAQHVGGEWPDRVARAAKAIVLNEWGVEESPVLSPAETLLEAAKAAFQTGETFLPTSTLLRRLMATDGWWTEQWTSPRAASMDFADTMGTFGIEHTRGYVGGKQHRGYALADMLDVLDDSWSDDEDDEDPSDPDTWDWDNLDD